MAGLRELVNVGLKMYYEIKDSEMYGGEGTTGYSMIEMEQCKTLENLTEEHLEAVKEDIAKTLGVQVENVRMITKEEYEANVEED